MKPPAPLPLVPFFVITTRGHGIRRATDPDDCARRLAKEIPIESVLYLREAEPADITYALDNGGSVPRVYREPTPTEDDDHA